MSDKHAQSFCNVLYFIDHAPKKSRLLEDVRSSYIKNGLTAVKVLKKYSIKPGSNKYNMLLNYIFLVTGIFKVSRNYKCYTKNRNIWMGRKDKWQS